MKSKFIILLTLLFCSCDIAIRMNDEGVVVKVEKNESASKQKYIVTVANVEPNIRGSIEIRTNRLYQVGDTIKFTKSR